MNISERLSNIDGWGNLIVIVGFIVLAFFIAKTAYSLSKAKTPPKKRQATRTLFYLVALFIVSSFFFFLNFGAGKPHTPTPIEQTGEYKQLQEIEDELDKAQLEQDVADKTTKELLIQSDDSLRDIYLEESEKKSDALTKKYLEQ